MTTAEMRKLLAGADKEGWTYCGSQDLVHQKADRVTPHMVFKRPTGAAAAGRADAAAALLAELAAQEAAARERAEVELRRAEAVRERDAAVAEQRRAEEAVKATGRAKLVEVDRAAAEKARNLEVEVEQLKAMIRELQAELRAKSGRPPARPTESKK